MVKPHIRLNGDITKTKNSSDVSSRRNEDDLYIAKNRNIEPDLYSLPSENSFKTASSEPPESIIPKQVYEIYNKPSNESVCNDRISCTRKNQESTLPDDLSQDQQICPQKPTRSHKRQTKE